MVPAPATLRAPPEDVVIDGDPADAGADPANRRGPFRPNRMAPVRERLSGATLARVFRMVDACLAAAAGSR